MKIRGQDACVPNWFYKDHFEDVLERKLTKHQFRLIADYVQEDLMDTVSDLVREYCVANKEDILKFLREEE